MIIEPIGSVAPKIAIGERRKDAEVNINGDLSMFCPAQSYPMPTFRYNFNFRSTRLKLKLVCCDYQLFANVPTFSDSFKEKCNLFLRAVLT